MTTAICLLMVMILLSYRTESQYVSRQGNYIDYNRGDLYMTAEGYGLTVLVSCPNDILMHWRVNHWVNDQQRYYSPPVVLFSPIFGHSFTMK